MAQIYIVIIMIVGVLLTPSAWADSELDTVLSKAKITVHTYDLERAKQALKESSTDAIRVENLKKVVEIQKELDEAIASAPIGTISDPVLSARQLILKKKRVDELKAKNAVSNTNNLLRSETGASKPDTETTQSNNEELKTAESELTKAAIEATEQEKLQDLADKRFA